jgi:putative transposase
MPPDDDAGGPRAWAHLRFSIIGPLLADPPPDGMLGKAIASLAQRVWRHPTEPARTLTFDAKTIERWYYQARREPDPVAVLTRRIRKDAGVEKVLTPALAQALAEQYGAHPNWTCQLHADNLRVLAHSDPQRYGKPPSYPTVRRAMRRRGFVRKKLPRHPTQGQLQAAHRLAHREVRSYEAVAVHALWHLDFHHARRRVLDAEGNWHTPVLLGILDDRSRLCCHLQWYLAETAENLVHGLLQAFCKRGLPRALMHDNGAAMRAAETVGGLSRLSVLDEPTLPYSPDQNGKQESFWGNIEGRLMPMLEAVQPLTLAFLNEATSAWVDGEYNHRVHDQLKTTPTKRMLEGPDVSRKASDIEEQRRAFTVRQARTQRRSDGTVTVGGVRFELPSRLRTLPRPMLRWSSWDLSTVYVVDAKTDAVLAVCHPLDKAKNASGQRRELDPVGVTLPAPSADPLPPLMRQLLAEHAATGLPPSYLPKDERPSGLVLEDDDA